jgi:hypothetical protein
MSVEVNDTGTKNVESLGDDVENVFGFFLNFYFNFLKHF